MLREFQSSFRIYFKYILKVFKPKQEKKASSYANFIALSAQFA